MTSNSPVCYANIPSGTSGRTHTERYSAVQPAGFGKIGMTIEEAADYTGIGRNTLRRLVDWGKIPVLDWAQVYCPRGCDLLFHADQRRPRPSGPQSGPCGEVNIETLKFSKRYV